MHAYMATYAKREHVYMHWRYFNMHARTHWHIYIFWHACMYLCVCPWLVNKREKCTLLTLLFHFFQWLSLLQLSFCYCCTCCYYAYLLLFLLLLSFGKWCAKAPFFRTLHNVTVACITNLPTSALSAFPLLAAMRSISCRPLYQLYHFYHLILFFEVSRTPLAPPSCYQCTGCQATPYNNLFFRAIIARSIHTLLSLLPFVFTT